MTSSVEMERETARRLFLSGGIFVFLNVPRRTEFGIDMKSWETDDKFKGIKMIPPGPHYIYCSPTNKHGDVAPRFGFIHVFQEGEILVGRYDSAKEDFSMNDVSEEDVQRLKSNIHELDQYLGAYPYDVWNKWRALSNNINESVVKRLTPATGCIRSALELVPSNSQAECSSNRNKRWSKARTEEEKQEDLLPQLSPAEGTQIRFSQLPAERYPPGSSATEITSNYLDSSYVLEKLLSSFENPIDFIGELQFSFVCFLIGLSMDAFEHWKRLVQLICNCERAIVKHPHIYTQFIVTLDAQLSEGVEDFLVDIVSSNNIIYCSLKDLFVTVQFSKYPFDRNLLLTISKFKKKLNLKFGWDFTDLEEDEGENAPTVVELLE